MVALSCGAANAANVAGYACVPESTLTISEPTSCNDHMSGHDGQTSTWIVTGCTGSDVEAFSGESLCSTTSSVHEAHAKPGNPSTGNGRYCWCQITSVTMTDNSQRDVSDPVSWVGGGGYVGYTECAEGCAHYCGDYARSSIFRTPLFSALGN
jgi:hypothetical protein